MAEITALQGMRLIDRYKRIRINAVDNFANRLNLAPHNDGVDDGYFAGTTLGRKFRHRVTGRAQRTRAQGGIGVLESHLKSRPDINPMHRASGNTDATAES